MKGNRGIDKHNNTTGGGSRKALQQAQDRGSLKYVDVRRRAPVPVITRMPGQGKHDVIQDQVLKTVRGEAGLRINMGHPTQGTAKLMGQSGGQHRRKEGRGT